MIDDVDADLMLKEALNDLLFTDMDVMNSKGVLYPLVSMMKKERELNGPYTADEAYDFQIVFNRLLQNSKARIIELLNFRHQSINKKTVNTNLMNFLVEQAGKWAGLYCKALRKENGLDFEDLICHVHRAMRSEEIRDRWQKRFSYIIVDEMQDTSEMEYDIIRCLFQGNHSMICDDYFQTIYEWRGSNPKRILKKYIEEFNPIHVCFTRNYRSARRLCSASFEYLRKAFPDEISQYYRSPALSIESGEDGDKIFHILTADVEHEAGIITEYLCKTEPEDPSRICVLSRNNYNIADLYKALMKIKQTSPHRYRFFTIDEEKKFSCKAVIKDILAFPRVLLSERTDDISFSRICRKLVKGVGEQTIRKIQQSGTIGLSLTSFIQADTCGMGDPYSSLIQCARNSDIVIYDTETTGLDLGKDQIIQIAAIRMDADGNIVDRLNKLVIPTVPISKGALATHHISMEDIRVHGIEARDALEQFRQFTDGKVLVGHNSIRFDLPLIQRQLTDCGLPELNIRGHYDTMMIAKQFMPASKNYKLATLIEPFGIVNKKAHDAMSDIETTGELLYCLIQKYILPTREERRNRIAKYRDKFIPVIQFLDQLENGFMKKSDFSGLIEKTISFYQYGNCEKESDREALNELKEYIGIAQQTKNRTNSTYRA